MTFVRKGKQKADTKVMNVSVLSTTLEIYIILDRLGEPLCRVFLLQSYIISPGFR